MDKDELIKLANESKYIPGIYNYCDRWCERCQFTARCLTYAMEENQNYQLEEVDRVNEKFWSSINNSFELALSLITDLAKQQGIDLESITIDEDEKIVDNKVNLLTHRAMNYADLVDEWFENNHNLIENALFQEEKQLPLKLINSQNTKTFISLQEVIEVIRYYQYAITVKLSRAINSRDNEAEINLEDVTKDSDGSAKIALIEIDRSINAWSELLKYFQAETIGILEIINYLQQIREIAETEFPNARAFIRPGFDEVDQNDCYK